MEFCDNCGKILEIRKIGICSCGFQKEIINDETYTEKIKSDNFEIEIFDYNKEKEKHKQHSGKFPHKCKKCSSWESEVVEIKTGFSDEADIYLFKCTNCGFTGRQADGSSNM